MASPHMQGDAIGIQFVLVGPDVTAVLWNNRVGEVADVIPHRYTAWTT
jgi:hypothetical protein